MKPIEIRIEGYKIVIEEDDRKPDGAKECAEPMKDALPTHPFIPCTPEAWWEHPYVTWTGGEQSTTNTAKVESQPVRDAMVGKTEEPDCSDGVCKIDFSQFKSNNGELVGKE